MDNLKHNIVYGSNKQTNKQLYVIIKTSDNTFFIALCNTNTILYTFIKTEASVRDILKSLLINVTLPAFIDLHFCLLDWMVALKQTFHIRKSPYSFLPFHSTVFQFYLIMFPVDPFHAVLLPVLLLQSTELEFQSSNHFQRLNVTFKP